MFSIKTILFQGDSVTAADRVINNEDDLGNGYAKIIADEINRRKPDEYNFINRGISGDTSACIYARMGTDILNIKPDYMTLLVGFNDISHLLTDNDGIPSHRYEQLLCMLVEDVKEFSPQTEIIILEPFALKGKITSSIWGSLEKGVRHNAELAKGVAEKYSLKFIPLQEKLNKLCETEPVDYWLKDGIHPTTEGHKFLAKEIMEALQL